MKSSSSIKTILGSDVNNRNDEGNTPLAYCAILGNLEIAKLLVAMDADLAHKNQSDLTPFHLSILYGHFFLTLYFLTLPQIEKYLENDENVFASLKIACRSGNIETFKLLAKHVKSWDYSPKSSYTILHYVCGCGFAQIYDIVIDKCMNQLVNCKNEAMESPLHWAVANNNKGRTCGSFFIGGSNFGDSVSYRE